MNKLVGLILVLSGLLMFGTGVFMAHLEKEPRWAVGCFFAYVATAAPGVWIAVRKTT